MQMEYDECYRPYVLPSAALLLRHLEADERVPPNHLYAARHALPGPARADPDEPNPARRPSAFSTAPRPVSRSRAR
jgi:hypothetical protein